MTKSKVTTIDWEYTATSLYTILSSQNMGGGGRMQSLAPVTTVQCYSYTSYTVLGWFIYGSKCYYFKHWPMPMSRVKHKLFDRRRNAIVRVLDFKWYVQLFFISLQTSVLSPVHTVHDHDVLRSRLNRLGRYVTALWCRCRISKLFCICHICVAQK